MKIDPFKDFYQHLTSETWIKRAEGTNGHLYNGLFLDYGKGSSECSEIKSSALLVPLKRLGRNDSVHVPLHYQLLQSILFENAIRTDVNEQATTCNDGGLANGWALKLMLLIDHTCLGNVCILYSLGRNRTKGHHTVFLTFAVSICSIKSAMKDAPDASWNLFFYICATFSSWDAAEEQ